ncbi:MAG TPA: hypothetical protein VMU51_13910 [Mycobacteriales bacterium]|nr:hypothetical protein [Mycobacteriales bacterium]
MRFRTPVVTLLTGAVLAAALLALSARANRQDAAAVARAADNQLADATAAGQPPGAASDRPTQPPTTEPPVTSQPPSKPAPRPEAATLNLTWAGDASAGATIAIVAKGTAAIAYLCDGARTEAWLKGTASGGRLDLTGAGGARLTGTFTDRRAEGTVTASDRQFRFDVPAAPVDSRLYRAAATVRGARIVAGWIVRADGRQVGLATVDGVLVRPSALDVTSGAATVGGMPVTASPAQPDGGPR